MIIYPLFIVAFSISTLIWIPGFLFILEDAPKKRLSIWWKVLVVLFWPLFLPLYFARRSLDIKYVYIPLLVAVLFTINLIPIHYKLNERAELDYLDINTREGNGYKLIKTASETEQAMSYGGIYAFSPRIFNKTPWENLMDSGAVIKITEHDMEQLSGSFAWRFFKWGIFFGNKITISTVLMDESGIPFKKIPYLNLWNPPPFMIVVILLLIAFLSQYIYLENRRR